MMGARRIHGFLIDIKNSLASFNIWGSILSVTLLTFLLPTHGCLLDRLFELYKGPPFYFMNDGGLMRFMAWMMPHTMVSVIIGKETELLIECQRLRLPRYRHRISFWLSHSIKTVIICTIYYSLQFILIIALTMLTGNNRPGVSSQSGHLMHASIDNTCLLIILLFIRVCPPMFVILQTQSLFHIAFRSAYVGGIAFILLVAAPAFFPENSFSKYIVGNWMILSRSIYMDSQSTINDMTVIIGVSTIFLLIQALGFCLLTRKNWY